MRRRSDIKYVRSSASPESREGVSAAAIHMTCCIPLLPHSCAGWAPPGGRGLLSLVEREYGSDGSLMEVHINPEP